MKLIQLSRFGLALATLIWASACGPFPAELEDPAGSILGSSFGEDDPEDFKLTGVIEALAETSVTVDGLTFTIDENTELDEGLEVGVVATVEYILLADGTFLTLEIETDADDDLDEDEDEDDDEDEDEDEDEGEDDDEDEDEDEDEDDDDEDEDDDEDDDDEDEDDDDDD